ncbi:MAG: bifunctional folylpolyglutamate synthase/dihydrofolate synthase [Deltaproteobacteria bacterium]|nr:bifunctional folylpolyglutamate synthase/dihydrofolate synthase [Deltaproteobacteria bacterium]
MNFQKEKNKSSYRNEVEYLYGLQKYGIKFGLSKTSSLLRAFGNPHHGKLYIHIAGTNGKGSVAAMLESILIKSGLKVGFYCSPHLVRFTERFRINMGEIPQDKAVEIIRELREVINSKEPPTFFEMTTAMALIYFAREMTDIAIMEVGMGGRLDATNVVDPLVSVITSIGLDHQSFLGSSLIEIAGEKAGIIKGGTDVATSVTKPSIVRLYEDICRRENAPLWRVGKDTRYRKTGSGLNYYGLNRRIKGLGLGFKGAYQNRNAALAITVIELLEKKGFKITLENIIEGMRDVSWPGRLQVVLKNPLLILDGAHNPDAIRKLAEAITSEFQYRRLILVLGVMKDKDIRGILDRAVPIADYVIYTAPDYYRSADPEILMKKSAPLKKPGETVPAVKKAIERAKAIAGREDLILVTGSLFTVGEALSCIDPHKYMPDGF